MICFAWSQFPQYAARCIGALVKTVHEEVVVVATHPRVPIAGMDCLAGCSVLWIEETDVRTLQDIAGGSPRLLFTSGWSTPTFNRFRDEVHSSGGRVIAMSDNNFHFSWREIMKSVRFRLFIRGKYDGFFVAGKSCAKLLRFYGVPVPKIQIGVYAADDTLFNGDGAPIVERPKKIIYVGQLIERKNVRRLCRAFAVANVNGEWSLELYGSGPLCDELNQIVKRPGYQTIHIHDFLQPEQLAAKYRESRIFCLPSLEEHWGLVVHEAALSGCVLLLSDEIGSKDDFVGMGNGFLFPATDESAFIDAMRHAMSLSDEEFNSASKESISIGKMISLNKFREGVQAFA